jgi:cell division protein FtsI (penicillin-binding protein 3)
MGARDAVYQLENRGLRVVLKGSGSVVAQQPYAGSPLVRGTIVRVELK